MLPSKIVRLARRPAMRALSGAVHLGGDGSIPVIDIGPFLSGAGSRASAESRASTAKRLAQACEHVGFVYVVNHGVDDALLSGVQIMARDFFSRDLPHKLRSAMQEHGPSMGRGYQQLGLNVTEGANDWHEAVDMFRQLSAEELAEPALQQVIANRPELEHVLAGRNVWPAAFDQVLCERYVARMCHLGAAVMRAMAASVGLPHGFFESNCLTDDSFWVLRFIHYPSVGRMPGVRGEGGVQGLGCGAHTDYGCLTIVNQDNTLGSLEVLGKDGKWIKADPQPGALCCNVGDMVERWTRGRYKSTLHRVLRPPANRSRVSVPFFFEPNALARIKPLVSSEPGAVDITGGGSGGGGRRPGYSPNPPGESKGEGAPAYDQEVMYIEHLYSKISTNFDTDR